MLATFYLAIGSNAWGVAKTAKEALAIHRGQRGRKLPCVIYKAPEGVKSMWVDNFGYTQFTVADGYDANEIAAMDWEVVREVK